MAQTSLLVHARLPRDLAAIALSYFAGDADKLRPTPFGVASLGQWEECDAILEVDEMLPGACYGGHLELAKLLIERGATYWDYGLAEACVGGHLPLARLMIAHGATDFYVGLTDACHNGHQQLVELMIESGAPSCWCKASIDSHLRRSGSMALSVQDR